MVATKRKNMSESYTKLPRVTSTHDRYYYDMLVELSDLIDFNLPIFNGKSLRNRSLGSVQTILVEMALQNDDILNNLRNYMILKGKDWTPITYWNMKKY
jgi:hypothetical protein